MSSAKKDFYGKEVTDAIKTACDTLQAPQEELSIEVVETGSLGIFGLIRKKAHIRVFVKGLELDSKSDAVEAEVAVIASKKPSKAKTNQKHKQKQKRR